MVLIFGWGNGRAEDRGEIVPVRCPNCHNDVVLHEIRSTKRISLYFVPVMPYGADEYLVCPICGRGLQIRPEHRVAVDAMRAATTAMRRGTLPEPQPAPLGRVGVGDGSRMCHVPCTRWRNV